MRITSLLVALWLTSVAHAEEPKQPEAAAHFQAGVAAFQAQQYTEASEHFAKAYDLEPLADLLWSWAQSERFAGHCVTAIGLYRKYEREAQTASKASAARDMVALCEQQLPRKPRPWYEDTLGDGITAGGIVGVGVGITFLALASHSHTAASEAMYLDDFEAKLDEATLRRRIGAVSLTLGAAAIAAGITVYVIHDRKQRERREVRAATDGRMVFVAGRF